MRRTKSRSSGTRRQKQDKQPLRLRIYAALRTSILQGELPSGQPLLEEQLARKYDVSKTPVREALNLLRHEGLVCGLPWRGWYVAPITLQDMTDVFEMRIILEVAAARRAANRISPEQLKKLEHAVREDLLNAKSQTSQVFVEANQLFHETLGEASGNSRLSKQISALLAESLRYVSIELQAPEHVAAMLADHNAILQVVKMGDAAAAAELMEKHLQQAEPGRRLHALI